MSDNKDPLALFAALGWNLEKLGDQHVGDCPFCHGTAKVYVAPDTGKWDCKSCMESGNGVTAMLKMHTKVYREELSDRRIASLATYRGMPSDAFACCPNLGFDPLNDRFTWAVVKPNGMPTSIRTFILPKTGKKNAVRALKGAPLGLLGGEALGDEARSGEPIYVCEGEWDYHAMLWALMVAGKPGIVVAVPGAGVFSKDWVGWFNGRDVIGCYDCDEAGRKGTVHCWEKLRAVAKSLKFIHWPRADKQEDGGKKDGYDVHDLVKDNLKNPGAALDYIAKHLKLPPTGQAEDSNALVRSDDRRTTQEELEPIGVDELHAAFDKWLLLSNYDLLDVTMGVLWTLYLPGNPIWMFVVAPPSGSKSETIMPASTWWRCHALSNMTSKSLVSGFQGPGGSDPSLMASLEGQRAALAIKDLTPLLQGRQEERDEVFGILRDAYDGSVVKVFGNGVKRDYKSLHFTMLAGVTPAIDTASHAALGERFLKFRADRDLDREDDIERAMRAIQNCGNEEAMRTELRDACVRSLVRPFDEHRVPKPSQEFASMIARLAYLVAHLRAVSPTERGSDRQTMHPMVEAPPRLATQFVKVSQGLALHLDLDTLDHERITRLVRRVALHTVDVISGTVAHVLYAMHGRSGIDTLSLGALLPRLSRDTVREVLQRFTRIGLLEVKKDGAAFMYRFKHSIFKLLDETRFFHDLPATDVHYRPDLPTSGRAEPARAFKVRRTKGL